MMIIYRFHYLVVYLYAILATLFVYPLALQLFLIVGQYPRAHIIYGLGDLESLAVHRVKGKIFQRLWLLTRLEHLAVHHGIVTLSEDALFDPNTQYAILVKRSAQRLGPVVKGYPLNGCLDSLDISPSPCMIGYTLKTRLSPLVFLAVLIKVSLLASLIFLGLVPYRTVTNLKEKQAVVILLNKIEKLSIT